MLAVGAASMVTLAEALALAPGPVQVSVKVLVPVAAGVSERLPERLCAPLQAPLAVQAVALLEDHVSRVLCPSAIVAGAALSVTVVAGVVLGGSELGHESHRAFASPRQQFQHRRLVGVHRGGKVRGQSAWPGNVGVTARINGDTIGDIPAGVAALIGAAEERGVDQARAGGRQAEERALSDPQRPSGGLHGV